MKILCTKKEDELYYKGPFWIIADTFSDILSGNFEIAGDKYLCNYNGDYIDSELIKRERSYKMVWEHLKSQYNNVDYTYYPRGRVYIYNGVAYIHIKSRCNVPKVIDAIINDYKIGKLELEIELNDIYQ